MFHVSTVDFFEEQTSQLFYTNIDYINKIEYTISQETHGTYKSITVILLHIRKTFLLRIPNINIYYIRMYWWLPADTIMRTCTSQ